MRRFATMPLMALVLTGSVPPPLGAAVAAQQREHSGVDADALCARYTKPQAPSGGDIVVTGTAQPRGRVPEAARSVPPPPPPPAYAPPPASSASPLAVTGSRVAPGPAADRDRYAGEAVSGVLAVADAPVSTFSVDVDTGSYTNVRRMLLQDGRLPPQDAVRTEEMLNYFRYDYVGPTDRQVPFGISTAIVRTPWNPDTRLLRIGLQGYDVARTERPAANLVFLVDVSGSMQGTDRLGLVQCSLAILAERLSPRDRVSIVVYAGAAGRVLDPTGDPRAIIAALDRLRAGGSTAGGAGLELAYATARASFVEGAINRVILATDGDFNVGVADNGALIDMIERQRASGIQLTTLGFGRGNYNEALMERAADSGNGNYAYIDSVAEARRVLDRQLSSTLFTIAHDVKIQVEFNPAQVREYRLIGYENRALAEEDFANDAVDAGEIGAGHQVTALYEIVPAGGRGWLPERTFPANRRASAPHGESPDDVVAVRLRYKLPGAGVSRDIQQIVGAPMLRSAGAARGDTAFAAAVAAYGQLLRGDTRLGGYTFEDVRALAAAHADGDPARAEFVRLAARADEMRPARSGR